LREMRSCVIFADDRLSIAASKGIPQLRPNSIILATCSSAEFFYLTGSAGGTVTDHSPVCKSRMALASELSK
jgi:hypothetical protein